MRDGNHQYSRMRDKREIVTDIMTHFHGFRDIQCSQCRTEFEQGKSDKRY